MDSISTNQKHVPELLFVSTSSISYFVRHRLCIDSPTLSVCLLVRLYLFDKYQKAKVKPLYQCVMASKTGKLSDAEQPAPNFLIVVVGAIIIDIMRFWIASVKPTSTATHTCCVCAKRGRGWGVSKGDGVRICPFTWLCNTHKHSNTVSILIVAIITIAADIEILPIQLGRQFIVRACSNVPA